MFFNKQQSMEVIIGSQSSLQGNLTSKGAVRIDGTLDGCITADCIIIGEKGNVMGDATVRQMIIGGRIVGNIRASEGVDIQRTGDVCGDISSARLSIADGAKFDGRSTMQRPKELTFQAESPAFEDASA